MTPKIKSIITALTILLAFIFYPLAILGLILIWLWTNWPKWLKIVLSVLCILITLSFLLTLVYTYYGSPYKVSGNAMSPTYENGEFIFTRIIKSQSDLYRGDVVILKSAEDDKKLIKRVIGLPGEKVYIKDESVYINDQKLDESQYLGSGIKTVAGQFVEGKIPDGQYFVLGDNRDFSADSRRFGFVKFENIISKVSFCYMHCK